MKVISCDACGKLFADTDMVNPDHCPECGSTDIREMTSEDRWSKDDLVSLWELLGDIPIDDDDRITEPFMDWPTGSNRFDIWYWFDKRYTGGVHTLISDVLR